MVGILGGRDVIGTVADHSHHGEGKHDEEDMTIPAMISAMVNDRASRTPASLQRRNR